MDSLKVQKANIFHIHFIVKAKCANNVEKKEQKVNYGGTKNSYPS